MPASSGDTNPSTAVQATTSVPSSIFMSADAMKLLLQQALNRGPQQAGIVGPTPYLKYVFEYFKIGSDLMNIFGNLRLRPFTAKVVKDAPRFGGLYFVFRSDSLVYVGISDRLHRRLGEHARGTSNLAKSIKRKYLPNDYRKFLAESLQLHWHEVDDPTYQRALEHVVIALFAPMFNQE